MDSDKSTLTSLKEIIISIMSRPELKSNPDDTKIWKIWDEVVGEAIAKNARPAWIKDGRLRIEVTDPIWRQELEFSAETIRENLNTRLKREAVQKIEFRLGQR